MLKTYSIRDSRIAEAPDGPIMVYVAPDEAERRFLVDSCRVDEHTLASALDPDELARLEDQAVRLVTRLRALQRKTE